MSEKITDLSSLESYLTAEDNSKSNVYFSKIPEVCKSYPCLLGVDEAGRGPVLGPMVYGTAFCPLNEATVPDSLGCDDSKALTEEERNKIFTKICENDKIGWGVEIIPPIKIDNSMLGRQKYSLNQVSMDAAINLIQTAINKGVNISHIYVDTVGPPEKYQDYLKSKFPKYGITVAKKADSTYSIVSAASICAKVSRDHALKVWKFQEGLNLKQESYGSGYPADPTTKKFLVDHIDPVFGYPQLVRSGWSTTEKILERDAYYVEWDDTQEEEVNVGNTSITSFFKMTSKNASGSKKMHEFFTKRDLSRKVEF